MPPLFTEVLTFLKGLTFRTSAIVFLGCVVIVVGLHTWHRIALVVRLNFDMIISNNEANAGRWFELEMLAVAVEPSLYRLLEEPI